MPYELIQLPTSTEKSDLNDIPSLLVFTIADGKQGTIGRHSTCDFRIKSDDLPCFVSRKHAHIGVKDGCLLVQDLSSANGTYVNNTMLKPYCETAVKAGDCVAFGCRTEKVTPGLKANEKDMPFRFKIHEVKVTAVRPTIFAKMKKDEIKKNARNNSSTKTASTSSVHSTNGQAKKTDEPDSGFDDQELHLPKKRRMSNDSEASMKFSSKMSKAKKANSKPPPVEEVDSEESASEPESPPRKQKRSTAKKVSASKSSTKDTDDDSDDDDDRSDDCQSYECLFRQSKTKKPKVVSWVQCDSCDRWFHTVCVGCDYNKVKLSSHQFHCGLC